MATFRNRIKTASASRRFRLIAGSALILILAMVAAGIWYWKTHRKAIIRNELEKAITTKSDGLYAIRYDDLALDEVAGSLSVTNLNLEHDTLRYAALEKEAKTPSTLFTIRIPELTVLGVKTPRALIDKEIVGTKLLIRNPSIEIIYTNAGKDSARHVPSNEIYQEILGNLKLIHIDTILITDATITTRTRRSARPIVSMEGVSIALTNVRIDSTANADASRILFARQIDIACSKIAWSSPDKLYNYTAADLSVSSVSRDFTLRQFRIDPTLNEPDFVAARKLQDDRFDFTFNKMSIRNISVPDLLNENLVADVLEIGSANFKIYRDLAIPRDKKNRIGLYPHQVIERIPVSVNIKKVLLSNTFLEYKEKSNISGMAGKVQFQNTSAVINNFTNDKSAIASNNLTTATVRSNFLNLAPLKTTWTFYLNHPAGKFDLKGQLGAIDAVKLNPLTEPMGPARMEEGHINEVTFDLHGNDHGMDGTVKMLYDDLEVAMLEKDKGAKELDKKFLTSLIAGFVIKESNPKNKRDPVRIATVHYDRDPNRSIFHLCWKTIFKGLKETVGVKK